MDGKQVLIFPRGQLTKREKDDLRKVGVVAVEVDDPKAVVVIRHDDCVLMRSELVDAMMYAITNENVSNNARELLGSELRKSAFNRAKVAKS